MEKKFTDTKKKTGARGEKGGVPLPVAPRPFPELPQLSPLVAYASAFLAVLATAAAQNMILPNPELTPFLLFPIVIILVSLLTGFWPGLLAVMLSALAGHFVFLEESHGVFEYSWLAFHPTIIFAMVSSCLVLISLYFRKTYFNLAKASDEREQANKKLRESEEKYKTLTETSPDCIKLFDTAGNLVYMNEGGLKEHGLKSVEEAKRWDYLGSVIPEDRPKFKRALEDAVAGRATTLEIRHTPAGSDRDTCLETFMPIKNDSREVTHIFGVSRDISEQKKTERAKTEFVSLASHQLRTPLQSAGFALEGMMSGMAGKLSDEQTEYTKDVYQDIKFMTDVVSRLLNVSRIEMGTFTEEPQKIDLKKFLDETVRGLAPLAKARTIKLASEYANDLPQTIEIDQGIFRNIIQNLISNAIKYTPAYGRIALGARADDSKIVITVADNGPGVPEELQPKLFTKMFRAHEMFSQEAESSGLGLYIAKLFTESLGGKIWFESKPGKGTTFYVSLPQESGGKQARK
jgi:PAS domain S-box-containing protein